MVKQNVLDINIVTAKPEYSFKNATYENKKENAVASYNNAKAEVRYNNDRIEFSVDMTEVLNDIGLKKVGTLIEDYGQKSEQDGKKDIQNIVQKGRNYVQPPNKRVEADAYYKNLMIQDLKKDFNIGFVPKKQAIVSFSDYNFEIDATIGEFSADFKTSIFSKGQYSRGNFDLTLNPKNRVDINYIGGFILPVSNSTAKTVDFKA